MFIYIYYLYATILANCDRSSRYDYPEPVWCGSVSDDHVFTLL